jgi:WhiB family transcriptional regulator, redox-sensing transcriptional regulator
MFKSVAADSLPAIVNAPAWLAAAVRSPEWTGEAACRHDDPELFFPEGTTGPALSQTMRARQVCQSCPVRTPCLALALEHSLGFGIWGGTTPEERRAIRRAMVRRQS